jgi:hypothetical protein
MFRRTLAALCLITAAAVPVQLDAQQPGELVRRLGRTGPRFGVTWMSAGTVDTIKALYNIDVLPVVTQFGWQFESQFASMDQGPVALNEWVLLVGGLDQGLFLPSLTWLVGVRTPGGFEFGVGPNATPATVALAMSIGNTFKAGALAIPVNIALVPSRFGMRASILTGFNIYK